MGEPTALGGLLGASLISLRYLTNTRQIRGRHLAYAILVFSLIGTGSRNAMISIVLAALLTSLLDLSRFSPIRVLALVVVSGCTLVILPFVLGPIIEIVARPGELSTTNQGNRLLIWLHVFDMYSNGGFANLLFGYGAGSLSEETGGVAAFNASLELLYAYGILGFVLYQLLFFTSAAIGFWRYRLTGYLVYKYGIMFLIYGYSFSLFMSFFPATDFNFSAFSFVLGIMLICTPAKGVHAN